METLLYDYPKNNVKSIVTSTSRSIGIPIYFVLGDNRIGSNDSRAWGTVPEENILGKVWSVYWPLSDLGVLH